MRIGNPSNVGLSRRESQHPDTHLPICLSAGRVSATFYIRSLGMSLSQTSQVIRTRSQQPSYQSTRLLSRQAIWRRTAWGLSLWELPIYLSKWSKTGVNIRYFAKSPCISARTSSVWIEIGGRWRTRTSDPLLVSYVSPVSHRLRITIALRLRAT